MTRRFAQKGLRFETPIGVINVDSSFLNREEYPPRFCSFQRKMESSFLSVRTDKCHTNVYWRQVEPSVPDDMNTDGTIAVLLRHLVTARSPGAEWKFRLEQSREKLEEIGPETGERLQAFTWSSEDGRLTIGTEDGDALRWRSENECGIPEHLADDIGFQNVIFLDDGGILVTLPELFEDDVVELRIAFSWELGADDSSLATWYAVDIPWPDILQELGIQNHNGLRSFSCD